MVVGSLLAELFLDMFVQVCIKLSGLPFFDGLSRLILPAFLIETLAYVLLEPGNGSSDMRVIEDKIHRDGADKSPGIVQLILAIWRGHAVDDCTLFSFVVPVMPTRDACHQEAVDVLFQDRRGGVKDSEGRPGARVSFGSLY
ncbi:uncharacterized protein HMPREF1120_09255 [Exophiala dermatitidis NIH/UT8656]|uniref:Uncharacterized protein n=1 Tax=Exophiala dermatitidis (strain ATCC 34100 / CBS 525.76 / NIH/UT8656) TaxID=858893 RepID=H6CC23_EXODN|nr:uncharacterized protein HMPREF1120_09255 [Exophiala dermatitidis NIH/UT8656]EHY61321.1 hypothetical protein HMPREF1120_09255 [Exophiala dermatitidis NIH/UT8656]